MHVGFFGIAEILSLLGLVQSVYVLVYMTFRSGNWRYAIIPIAYFTVLSGAFLLDAAQTRWQDNFVHYAFYQWALWFSGVPLGVLLIFQVARTPDLPPARYLLLLILIPLSLAFYFIDRDMKGDLDLVYVSGLVAGALALLAVWLRRDMLGGLVTEPHAGGERFWLILALIVIQTAFLASTFAHVSNWLDLSDWLLIRNVLGLGVVYISATSLFRIYPQAIKVARKQPDQEISADDQEIVARLQNLFERDKLYQEPDFGRAEMARELDIGEAVLSRIINKHYGKTIPQILNDYRVRDAKRLLVDTDAPISRVFMESGFSSMTTFNRVFKEQTGFSPKEYRSINKS